MPTRETLIGPFGEAPFDVGMTLVEYITGLLTGPPGGPHNGDTSIGGGSAPVSPSRQPETPDEEPRNPVVYECRRCGTTVSAETTRCPSCDRRTIAEYPVS